MATALLNYFTPAAMNFAKSAVSDPATSSASAEEFTKFHAAVHKFLDTLYPKIANKVEGLNEERSTIDTRSKLAIYNYWWMTGDNAFLQLDTRDPRIVLGTLEMVVSAEKGITPERASAMRDLANAPYLKEYCKPGRRNTRWSFLYITISVNDFGAADQIAEILRAMHKIEKTEFPKTFSGRFR